MEKHVDINWFLELVAFVSYNSDGYKAYRSKILKKGEIDKFLREAAKRDLYK